MTVQYLLPILAMITLLVVIVAALRSKRKTEEIRKDPEAPPSALARDGDPHAPQTDETIREAKAD